jgi:hypothetical protein
MRDGILCQWEPTGTHLFVFSLSLGFTMLPRYLIHLSDTAVD